MQNVIGSNHKKKFSIKVEKYSQIAIINDLISLIKKLKLRDYRTEWVNYYNFTNYKEESFEHKKKIILEYKNLVNLAKVWDFGANTGEFSRLFKNCAGEIVSLDIDPLAIEENYRRAKEENNLESLYSTFTAYYTPEENYEHVKNCKTLINFFINFSNYEFNTNVKNKPDKKLEIYKTEPIQEYSIIKEVKVAKDVTSKLKY